MSKIGKAFLVTGIIAAVGAVLLAIGIAGGGWDQVLVSPFKLLNNRIEVNAMNGSFFMDFDVPDGAVLGNATFDASRADELVLDLGAIDISFVESKDGKINISDPNNLIYSYIESGELYLVRKNSGNRKYDNEKVIVEIPANKSFKSVEIDCGAANVEFEELIGDEINVNGGAANMEFGKLKCDSIDIDMGAGNFAVSSGDAGSLDVDLSAGAFSFEGKLNGNADFDCAMGSISLKLDGDEDDFNYDIDGALGDIKIGNDTIKGMESYEIDNDAAKDITISCSTGEVTIDFN